MSASSIFGSIVIPAIGISRLCSGISKWNELLEFGFDAEQFPLSDGMGWGGFLPKGRRSRTLPISMTFRLADEQAEALNSAIEQIKSGHVKPSGMKNQNGNALYQLVSNGLGKRISRKVIPATAAKFVPEAPLFRARSVQNPSLHFGAFLNGILHGVMQFGNPIDKRKVIGFVEGTLWNEFLELNRMAFDEHLPRNSESRCISIAIRLLRKNAPPHQMDFIICRWVPMWRREQSTALRVSCSAGSTKTILLSSSLRRAARKHGTSKRNFTGANQGFQHLFDPQRIETKCGSDPPLTRSTASGPGCIRGRR